jgi:hypothetical protein
MFFDPVKSALIGWLVSMVSRQSGHFFFEPKGYDQVNQATHEHKEDIKVGYNLRRKVVLHALWILVPLVLWLDPSCFGLFKQADSTQFVRHLGEIWLALGLGALVFRTVQLFFLKGIQTGLVWATKILTDPFNDAIIYRKAPLYLMRGELIDPMWDVEAHSGAAAAAGAAPAGAAAGCGEDEIPPSPNRA